MVPGSSAGAESGHTISFNGTLQDRIFSGHPGAREMLRVVTKSAPEAAKGLLKRPEGIKKGGWQRLEAPGSAQNRREVIARSG